MVLGPVLVGVRMLVVGMPRVFRVVVLVDMVLGSAGHVVMSLPVRVDMRMLVARMLRVVRMLVLVVLGRCLLHDLALLSAGVGRLAQENASHASIYACTRIGR